MNALKRKAVRGCNTLTAIKKTNNENPMNAIKSIAACARYTFTTSRFSVNPYVGIGKRESVRRTLCATLQAGAINTTKQAFKLYVNELFSRPEFATTGIPVVHGFGAGSAYPQGRQHNLFCVLKPSSTLCPQQADGGLQFNKERETMTTVNTTTTPEAATTGLTPTFPGSVQRQIAIETALADALYYSRLPYSNRTLRATTARTRRALTLLKQACADAKNGSAA